MYVRNRVEKIMIDRMLWVLHSIMCDKYNLWNYDNIKYKIEILFCD